MELDKTLLNEGSKSFLDEYSSKIEELGYHLACGVGLDETNPTIEARVFYDRRLRKKDQKTMDELFPEIMVYVDNQWHYRTPNVSMTKDLLVHEHSEVEVPIKVAYGKTPRVST